MLLAANLVRATQIAACLSAVERETATPRRIRVADVRQRLQFNGSDLRSDAVAHLIDGEVAAFAHLWRHGAQEIRLFARTRPQSRGRGAGRSLLAWGLRRAHELCAGCAVTATSQSTDPSARGLLVDMRFSPVREITTLAIEPAAVHNERRLLDGVGIRAYEPADEEELRHAHALAFAAEWGYELPPSSAAWWAERSDVDPAQSLVAYCGEALVGFCLSGGSRIAEIGVVPAFRSQGIGGMLLQAGIEVLNSGGATSVSLQADSLNSSGALAMYARAGMRTLSSMTVWQRDPSNPGLRVAMQDAQPGTGRR